MKMIRIAKKYQYNPRRTYRSHLLAVAPLLERRLASHDDIVLWQWRLLAPKERAFRLMQTKKKSIN